MPVLDHQEFFERTRDAQVVATASDDEIMELYQEIGDPWEAADGVRRLLLEGISVEDPVRRRFFAGPYWLIPVAAVALIAGVAFVTRVLTDLRVPNTPARVALKPLQASADQADALLELGVRDLVGNRYEDAGEAFRRAYELDPNNLRGLLGMAEVYFKLDQPAKAVQAVADEVNKRPERRDLKKELANAEFRAGQYDQAIADYLAIIDRFKDSPVEQAEIYARAGVIYGKNDEWEQAVENLQKARQLAPTNVGYVSQLAQFLDVAGRQSEAIAAYRDALKLDPDNGVVLNNLAYLLAVTGGDLDEALTMALRAEQILPNFTEVSDTIGWIYIKKHMSDRAIETFRDLTDKVAGNSTFHYHYALALEQKGDDEGALRELKRALQSKPREREEMEINALIHEISGR